jgi:hypothetical protein
MSAPLPSAAPGPRTARSPLARFGALVAVALALAACGGSASMLSTVGGPVDVNSAAAPMAAPTAAPAEDGGKSGDEGYRAADVDLGNGPLIVRTGQLTLEVTVLDDALADADAAVTAAGGYVAASQRQGDDDTASATVTYRIPAERWEATLAALRAVGTKVLSEQTASEEVTSQVVDLGARLANLRATESALQAIMAKATKIPDILEVQGQLTSVRQEIEQLTAQKLSLEKQAALATLTVGFSLPPTVAVAQVQEGWDPADEVDRAAATLVGVGQGVANAAIWVAIVFVPLAIVLGIAIGIAWLIARRLRPRSTPPAAPTPAAPMDAPAA